jgi:hypothetical protein
MSDAYPSSPVSLRLSEACAQLGAHQRVRPPRILHQFWDRNPPRQIQKLLTQCGKICAEAGVEHRVWEAASGAQLLADGFPDIVCRAYDVAPHASMKSDILRMAILHRHGGVYLDADMALRAQTGPHLWLSFTDALLFKWNLPDRHNTPTWCMGFRAGHDLTWNALLHMSGRMVAAVAADGEGAIKRALALGPGALTEAVGGWIAAHGAEGITILDVAEAYRMVQNGPEFLKAPLDYKTTALHWLVAGRGGG